MAIIMENHRITGYIKMADIFTLFNLYFGFVGILFFIHGNFTYGSYCLLASFLLDFVDGKIARALKSGPTDFGKYLDFADIVSFGVAPAILMSLLNPGFIGAGVAVLFLTSGLLRLARFGATDTDYCIGVPITVNGLIFPAAYLIISCFSLSPSYLLALALFASALMLGSFRVDKVV